MNGYVCFWQGQRVEVYAKTQYEAQLAAAVEFRKGTRKTVKTYNIAVVLAEKDGKKVTHLPLF